MFKVKYIKTKNNKIIVFSGYHQHSDFRMFEPVSAGFIAFGAKGKHEPDCTCYGESISLGLKADVQVDTQLAKQQILNMMY